MNLNSELVNNFAAELKEKGKQPATVESYTRDAHRFIEFLDSNKLHAKQVEPNTLVAFQKHLREACEERDNSIRRTVIGVRQFYRYLSSSGEISDSPFDSVAIPSRDERLREDLTTTQVESLLESAAEGRHAFKSARDTSIIALLAFEGIKAGELINIYWHDFIVEGDHATLAIAGSKQRTIRLSAEVKSYLIQYKNLYATIEHPTIQNANPQRMFIAFKGREAASPIPEMTRHGLKFILYEMGEKVGLKKLNTEQLRHYAVNHLISLGRSSEEIMQHLGLKRLGNIAKHMSKSKKDTSRPLQGATRE